MSEIAEQPFAQWTILEWRSVVGFEGIYEVSSDGQVRRIGRAARTGKGRGGGARPGRVLKARYNKGGYQIVQLWSDGLQRGKLVHVLVAEAFLGPCPAGHEVNHKDGIKANCAAINLEYLTRSDNVKHAWHMELRSRRPRKVAAKVADVIALSAAGMSQRSIAKTTKLSRESIRRIQREAVS